MEGWAGARQGQNLFCLFSTAPFLGCWPFSVRVGSELSDLLGSVYCVLV